MAQEYRVTSISAEPPRQWDGPNGTVFYIGATLEGHQKPVAIGKKDPQALKVGDIVFGDIQSTQYPQDKFKPASKPQWGAQPSYQAPQQTAPLIDMGSPANVETSQLLDGQHKTYAKLLEVEKKLDDVLNGKDPVVDELQGFHTSDEAPVDMSEIPF